MLTPDEEVRKGNRAQSILADDVFREAVESAREDMVEKWLASPELVDREAYWAKIHGLGAIEDILRGFMADGELAASKIEE